MEVYKDKNIAVVCNPLAGVGKSVILTGRIALDLKEREISHTVFKARWPRDFNEFSDVFIVGGDGTLNYFFNQYPNIKQPLAVFSGGTGNDVHSLLYPGCSYEENLHTALTAEPKPVDGGKCNEKYFINGVGVGFEGAVAKSLTGKKKKPGKASFMSAILRKIFFYNSKNYRVNAEELNMENRYLLVSVMNGHRAGGGFHIAPASKIDDGLLDVVLVEKLHPFMRFRWLPVIEKGKHLSLPFIKHFRTAKIIITGDELIQAHLDGEYYEANRLEIEILPGKYLFCF